MSIFDRLVIETDPIANEKAIVKGEKFRITVLTSRLFRLEYSNDGIFEDRPTKLAVCRNFDVPKFKVIDENESLEIITDHLHLFYNKKPFSPEGLRVELVHKKSVTVSAGKKTGNVWKFGDEPETLDGTYRTLDCAEGDIYTHDYSADKSHKIDLGSSLMNFKTGFSILDDSETVAITEDGWSVPIRKKGRVDIYLFDYWTDYKQCLKDFYHLSGKTPLLPRYALGNWWSRYYRYTEESYCNLLDKFEKEGYPFSVGVLDMDWHRTVDIPKEYGTGWSVRWTGYSWDKTIFPNPKRFLKYIHDKGLKTTLNLHPADGIRGFEDCYDKMADAMGVDKKNKAPVEFDVTSKEFLDNYFKIVINELEDDGVDFWWIDWQQGGTDVNGYDTLWMLNHYHFIDSARRGERPITFSRYAGIGSHRYPIGFSGDTIVSWKTLAYQPYFTNCATNVGYGWWSHDIGGHMNGVRDGDLTSRWVQYGVFSPINRLHATQCTFGSKEPWTYTKETELSMKKFLRLRHKLIPYLYTMNERAHSEDLPLILPLYYNEPDNKLLYRSTYKNIYQKEKCPYENQYYFGSELMVSPIVTPTDKKIHLGKVDTYLPDGKWIDFFNGRIYNGGKAQFIHRAFDEMPVFAKVGAIVPLTHDDEIKNSVDNPKKFEIRVFAGADGTFTMYEDNGKTKKYVKTARTKFDFKNGKIAKFSINPVVGDLSVIPNKRDYLINVYAMSKPISITVNGKVTEFDFNEEKNMTSVCVNNISGIDPVEVCFETNGEMPKNNINAPLYHMINAAEIKLDEKESIYKQALLLAQGKLAAITQLEKIKNEENSLLIDAVFELIFADE